MSPGVSVVTAVHPRQVEFAQVWQVEFAQVCLVIVVAPGQFCQLWTLAMASGFVLLIRFHGFLGQE